MTDKVNGRIDSEKYKKGAPDPLSYGHFILDRFPKLLDGQVKTVLDVGCGNGEIAVELRERGYSVVCIDASLEFVESTERKISDTKKRLGLPECDESFTVTLCSGENISKKFEANSFDFVISNAVLHWLVGDRHQNCLNGIKKVLKEGGQFINANASLGSEKAKLSQCLMEAMKEVGVPWKMYSEWITKEEMGKRLALAGFDTSTEQAVGIEECNSKLPDGAEGWMRSFAQACVDKELRPDGVITSEEMEKIAEIGGQKYRSACSAIGQSPDVAKYERHNNVVKPLKEISKEQAEALKSGRGKESAFKN